MTLGPIDRTPGIPGSDKNGDAYQLVLVWKGPLYHKSRVEKSFTKKDICSSLSFSAPIKHFILSSSIPLPWFFFEARRGFKGRLILLLLVRTSLLFLHNGACLVILPLTLSYPHQSPVSGAGHLCHFEEKMRSNLATKHWQEELEKKIMTNL